MEEIISVKGLVKEYSGKRALDGIDIHVKSGEMYAFLGPNGAGKTTAVRILSTLADFDSGEVYISGHDVRKEPIQAKAAIGVIQQQISLDKDLTVWENMMVHAMYHKIPRSERKGRIDELADYIGLREYYDRKVDTLSGGWKKKVAIVCALVDRPKLLFLDEPTVGLDIQSRRSMWDLLRKLNDDGMTIFLTTHYIEEAESLCSRVSIIDHGRIIAEDTPSELSKRLGSFTVEYYNSERRTQYRYFDSKDEADSFTKTLDDSNTVLLRRTNLSDVFVELTGSHLTDNGTANGKGGDVMSILNEIYYVAWGDLRYMRHTIKNILISSLVTPILYLLAFGYGINGGDIVVDGVAVPYLDFVIPGIIALTTLSASFSATSSRLNVQRLYYRCFDEMMMCPLSCSAIVIGKAVIGVIRGVLGAGLMFVIGYVLEPSFLHLTPLFVISLLIACFTFSFLGVSAALLAKSHASMATFSSLVITPMTFLCGTFFAVENLPIWAQGALYILPLTEASVCIRSATLDIYAFPFWALGVLCIFMIAFFLLDYYLIRYRKI